MEVCTNKPSIQQLISNLAVEVCTELGRVEQTERSITDVVKMEAEAAVQYIRSGFLALCGKIRCFSEVSLTDTERASLEQCLQKLEAELRTKAKVSPSQTEFELTLQLSEAKKSISQLANPPPKPPTKDSAANTDVEQRGQTEVGKATIAGPGDEFIREERDKLVKALITAQAEGKRSLQIIADLERRLSRVEVDLMEIGDSLAERARECDRWKKECEILNLSAKHREFACGVFSESRRKFTRKRFEGRLLLKHDTPSSHQHMRNQFADLRTSSYSPVKPLHLRKENSTKSLQTVTPGAIRTLSEGCGELVFGKAIPILKPRNSSVRDLKRVPQLRKQTAPTKSS